MKKKTALCAVILAISAALALMYCNGGLSTGHSSELDEFIDGLGIVGIDCGSYTYTGRTVRIGNLTWMAENLSCYTSNSWCYDRNSFNCAKYGRLYTWDAAMAACPVGWRLPTRQDWDDLVSAADDWEVAGRKLKSASGWNSDGNGTDELGFSALPGGFRWGGGSSSSAGINGYWWSATEYGSGNAYYRVMYYSNDVAVEGYYYGKSFGFSARCVRDERL